MCIYMCVYTHTYIYMYTHTYMFLKKIFLLLVRLLKIKSKYFISFWLSTLFLTDVYLW